MDNKQFEQIMTKLDRITSLLALDAIKELEPEEQISRLADMKFQPMEIAPIVGKTPNAVRIALHYIRKKKPKGEEPLEVPSEPMEKSVSGGLDAHAKD